MERMSGADPIGDIMAAIVTVQAAITPPTDFAVPIVWENLTANPGSYPAWLNVPDGAEAFDRSGGTRTMTRVINTYLVFNAQEYNYASAEQRAWEPLVLDAFDQNLKLGGGVQLAEITKVDYAPIDIGGIPYVALTFRLEIVTSEPYAFGA